LECASNPLPRIVFGGSSLSSARRLKIVGIGNGKSLPVCRSKPTFERAPDIVGVGQQQNISPLAQTCKKSRQAEAIPAGNDQQRKAGTGPTRTASK
jgi:hypothetical protein